MRCKLAKCKCKKIKNDYFLDDFHLKRFIRLIIVFSSDGHGKKNNSRPTMASGKNSTTDHGFDGVFDAVTITVYYWKNYQAYLVLIYDKIIRNL